MKDIKIHLEAAMLVATASAAHLALGVGLFHLVGWWAVPVGGAATALACLAAALLAETMADDGKEGSA